ncbi:diacylglycerol/lipid kinase family protein [Pseudolysinimonas yzui]|uniref:Sphingosine kinase n=1 Tax=Pseudolysinimonas yzui TaxID=2708254 RepID=A0A8J3M355_9MICO|nr:diacylglycerol kinase family protein [Pseudolysinimonas yzui]GHF26842.1 sphingosine kinase [Pseudolysinimonas yzui]
MSPAAPSHRRAAIIYNPLKVDKAKLRSSVATAEKAAGWDKSLWFETTAEEAGGGLAKKAAAEKVEVVLAAGGDGTVRAVAEGLRDTKVALALLPAGTGNLLARNLDLPLSDLDSSVQAAFTGEDRDIDLGLVEIERPDGATEQHAFVVMAGIGLDAKMVANTNPELKKRVGWLAYADAIARSLRDAKQLRISFRADDGAARTMRAHTVLVGNCGLLPGNVLLLPDASLDDGVLDIVALRPEGFFGWAQVWVKIVWENGVLRRSSVGRKMMGYTREIRTLRYLKASTFEVRLDRAEEFELDGDEFGVVVGFRTEVDAGALTVRVPAA